MRALVQNCSDGMYLLMNGSWSFSKEEAHTFGSSFEAAKTCIDRGLRDVNVVLTFEETNMADVCLPLTLRRANVKVADQSISE